MFSKNIFVKSALTIAITLFTVSLFAQKKKSKMDYLISVKNDTIYGKFKKPLFGPLKFESEGGTYELDPTLFKAYYDASDKRIYEQKTVNGQPAWLACIVDGKIKLYEQFYNTTQADGKLLMVRIWLAQKDNMPLQEVYSSTLTIQRPVGKPNLEYLIRDNPNLFSKLQATTNYSYKVAKAFIEVYNQSWSADSSKQ